MRISIFWVDIDLFVRCFNSTSLPSLYSCRETAHDAPGLQFHGAHITKINGIWITTVRDLSCTFNQFNDYLRNRLLEFYAGISACLPAILFQDEYASLILPKRHCN
jgi:hypothetical protein